MNLANRSWAKQSLVVVAAGALLALCGLAIPWRGEQNGGGVELFSAVAVCLLAFLLGALPMHGGKVTAADGALLRVFYAMFLRFSVTVVLCAAILVSGRLHTGAFLVWVAIAYVVLLPVDTVMAVRLFRGEV